MAVGELNELNSRVLFVVLFEVGEEMLAVSSVDGGCNIFGAFSEHREYTVVNEVVDQDDSAFSAPDEVGNISPSIPYAAGGENCFGELFWSDFINPVKNKVDLFIGFLLMMLDVNNTLYHLQALIDDLRYGSEGTHDTDIDANSSF